jgi:negative regulator of flagellin synthesis FlgM
MANLHSSAELVEKLKAQVDAIPEVRWERVEALRRAMAEGIYEISPERIAEAMLAETWQVERD